MFLNRRQAVKDGSKETVHTRLALREKREGTCAGNLFLGVGRDLDLGQLWREGRKK